MVMICQDIFSDRESVQYVWADKNGANVNLSFEISEKISYLSIVVIL